MDEHQGAHQALARGGIGRRTTVMGSVARILIVDDEERQRRTLSIALRLDGFEVECASSADDALEILEHRPCDLALVDLMMPGVNGLDLARQVQRLFPHVKVVLTSAYHLSERQLLRAECGAVGFVPKPYNMPDLVAFLRSKTEVVE
jgi:DNA-binding response OmpR family regulator